MTVKTNPRPLLSLPFVVALFITFIPVAFWEMSITRMTHGAAMYPLDDTFIHMDIARNFAASGTWGINPGEFASASSSLLYTLLLALLFKIFSFSTWIPLLINCIAAALLLWVADRWLASKQISVMARTIILLAFIFLVPLPVMVISGMEHLLQLLFAFLFLTRFTDWIEENAGKGDAHKWKISPDLLVYAFLVGSIRYEGIFIVGLACLVLLLYKKLLPAILLGVASFLLIVIFGFISVKAGSYFLPNSVLVKSAGMSGAGKGLVGFISDILVLKLTVVRTDNIPRGSSPPGISLLVTQRLLIILPLLLLMLRKKFVEHRSQMLLLSLVLFTVLAHVALASTGWFYRYEAYLVGLSCLASGVLIAYYVKPVWKDLSFYFRLVTGILLFALFFPFLLRSGAAIGRAKQACMNIYEQQYQMAEFAQRYYNNDAVALNDIGAVSLKTDSKVIDLWGLGNITVAKAKKSGNYTPDFIDSLVRSNNVKLIMLYDDWYEPGVLAKWIKVGSWTVQNNAVLGDDTVSFYVTDAADREVLLGRLKEFSAVLPPGVTADYITVK